MVCESRWDVVVDWFRRWLGECRPRRARWNIGRSRAVVVVRDARQSSWVVLIDNHRGRRYDRCESGGHAFEQWKLAHGLLFDQVLVLPCCAKTEAEAVQVALVMLLEAQLGTIARACQ